MPKLSKIVTRTLSLRLSLIMVCAIALLLTAALFVMFHFSRQSLKNEVISDAEETLKGKAKQIDNILLSVEQTVGNVYWNMIHHLGQPDRMETYCREIVKSNPYIYGCAVAFQPNYHPLHEYSMTYVHRKDSLASVDCGELVTQHSFTSQSYTSQAWFTEPIETGRAGWTEPLKNEATEDKAFLTFCLPIFGKGGDRVGVLAVDVSIHVLSNAILADMSSSECYVTLLAQNGSFIIHPDKEKLSHQTAFTQTEQDSLSSDALIWGDLNSLSEIAQSMVNGEAGFMPYLMNGKKKYMLFRPFSLDEVPGRAMANLGWSIGVIYPEEVIFHEYNQLLYYLIAITVVGLLLFFLLCRTITHRELMPLRYLTRTAQRIAAGNYEETIPDTNREDEIGRLQVHFQKMLHALKIRNKEQERLSVYLKERGEVLQEAYSQAQKANQMKTSFLHFMTNQMLQPADNIEKSVTDICNHCDGDPQEMEHLADTVWQQGSVLIEVLNRLIKEADDYTEGGSQ